MQQSIARVCLAVAVLASLKCAVLGQGQDNWERQTQRKLSTPDTTTTRKCITISKSGIYVGKSSDGGNTGVGVEQYALSGSYVKTWTTTFTNIGGLASDGDGNVYVFDQGAGKVLVFDANGAAVRNFGSPGTADGQFSTSSGYMVHAIAVDGDKNVYVADYGNHRIQKFNASGVFQLKFGVAGDLPGQFRDGPNAVAATPQGTLITSDAPNGWYHLSIFSADGKLLKRGVQGDGNSENNQQASWGSGGNKSFSVSDDGVLMVGAETGGFANWYGAPGCSRGFSTSTLEQNSYAWFLTSVSTRGTAFDPSGNFWAVRDKAVECLLRRMRFDLHLPAKAIPQPVVTKVSQVPGSSIVDIDYRVSDADSATVNTALAAFIDGNVRWDKLVIPKTFTSVVTGSLGSGVPAGNKLRVSWDASKDMPGQNFATLSFRALAKDERPEIGVHFVTIPADAANPAALKISNNPISEQDLWDLWLWLLAKGDSRVTLSGNTVALTDAGKTFISGAPLPTGGNNKANLVHDGSTSTMQGRAFACKLINCRPATGPEQTRAQAGRFNLGGVNYNSVISLAP
jgi:hypothetical protein